MFKQSQVCCSRQRLKPDYVNVHALSKKNIHNKSHLVNNLAETAEGYDNTSLSISKLLIHTGNTQKPSALTKQINHRSFACQGGT